MAAEASHIGVPEALSGQRVAAQPVATHRVDVLVIGSGIAGLTAALAAATLGSVALVTKSRLSDTNTWLAQGGIAGAVGEADSVELHLADTLVVGQGLCNEAVVRAVVAEAPDALADLQTIGMHFDMADSDHVALAREGGHSLPRVLHSGDTTGAAVQQALTGAIRERGGVSVFEHRFLLDLTIAGGACTGAKVLDTETGEVEAFQAGAVVLATGGAGQVYRVTTNPLIATGDGVAAAWRAGARISDMEFVQFHPTAFDNESAPRFLVSEAVRGEGAYLLDCDHERFMVGVHPLAELAPRDVVSREIERVMQRCGRGNVWLDARHLGADLLKSRFPLIWQTCADAGYDLSKDLLPVVPAAHYLVGGVKIDVDGHTSIPGLFASGEVSASGLHGANRLASNSLLEGLVFSRRIVRSLSEHGASPAASLPAEKPEPVTTYSPRPTGSAPAASESAAADTKADLQAAAGAFLGMGRTADGLEALLDLIGGFARRQLPMTPEGLEAANLITVAALSASAALLREETRGCHSRLDFPERDDVHWRVHSVFTKGLPPAIIPVGDRHTERT